MLVLVEKVLAVLLVVGLLLAAPTWLRRQLRLWAGRWPWRR